MARNEKRRQKALARKAARRKAKRHGRHGSDEGRVNVARVPEAAARWPLHEILISEDWNRRDGTLLTEVVVARRGPAGGIAAGICLVDLDCLGVKNAFARLLSQADYEYMKSKLATPKIAVDLNLAARVIQAGIDYAAELGFEPHPDFAEMEPLLEGAQPALCDRPVPVGGDDGKPFYVAGPADDVEAIVATLSQRLGRDGFRFIAPLADTGPLDAFELDAAEDVEPFQNSPLSIDDVQLVEPVSLSAADPGRARWIRRLGIA